MSDQARNNAARIVGLAIPLSFVIVTVANFAILGRFFVRGNPAETARNILANEQLFRLGIVGDLLYCVGNLAVVAALYVILKPVDPNLALLSVLGRLVHVFTWVLVTVNLFTALRLLRDASYLHAFGDQLPSVARLYLGGFDAYYVGLLVWSLGSAVGGWLWFRSGYIPRPLAAFGMISSAWCAACTLAFDIFPDFSKAVNLWWFDSPMAIFELVLSFWLLFKGLAPAHER